MQYRTQCPHCQTIYPVPESKATDPNARAKCANCQNKFVVSANLIKQPAQASQQNVNQQTPTEQGGDDKISLPKIPIKHKKAKKNTPIDDGLIHDDMSGNDNVDLSDIDSELDNFIKQSINTQPTTQNNAPSANAQHNNDEAWLNDLLKDNNTNIETAGAAASDNDVLSELSDEDLTTLIPTAPKESPDEILQKINQRISHNPTQEQLVTRRSSARNIAWGVGCVLMLILLGAQYVFFNGDAIAKTNNAPMVNSLCQNCLPSADPSAFATTYRLQNLGTQTRMIGTLSNQSTTDQLYPNLKITLIGDTGVVGDMALAPKDYLAFPQRLIQPYQDGQDNRFMLTFNYPSDNIKAISIEPFY